MVISEFPSSRQARERGSSMPNIACLTGILVKQVDCFNVLSYDRAFIQKEMYQIFDHRILMKGMGQATAIYGVLTFND
jgi:hypothetical protein